MKILIICLLAYSFLDSSTYSQDSSIRGKYGIWDATITSIQKADTVFVVTGMDLFEDGSPTGIYFEWYANKEAIKELHTGMIIDFDKGPGKGYWKYKDIYMKGKKRKNNHK